MPAAIYCPAKTCVHRNNEKPPFEIAGIPKSEGQCTYPGPLTLTWCRCSDSCDSFECLGYERRKGT